MSPTDYDTWLTEGDIQTCQRCGRRERMHYAGLCGACDDAAEDEPRREGRETVLGLRLVPGRSGIVSEVRHGLRLTCRATGAGYEVTAEWGACAGPRETDYRGSLTVLRLELWRALEDMEGALEYLADCVEELRNGGGE